MRVYVVMGNNFPDAVFAKLADANAYCEVRRKEHLLSVLKVELYWRPYQFDVIEESVDA
jgi:hypothetical protein